jgi:hypothetical protein
MSEIVEPQIRGQFEAFSQRGLSAGNHATLKWLPVALEHPAIPVAVSSQRLPGSRSTRKVAARGDREEVQRAEVFIANATTSLRACAAVSAGRSGAS